MFATKTDYVFVETSTSPTNSSHAVVVLLRSLRWALAELPGDCMLPNAGTWTVQYNRIRDDALSRATVTNRYYTIGPYYRCKKT